MTASSTADVAPSADRERAALAELYALLSTCFTPPDERFRETVRSGQLEAELSERLTILGLAPDRPPMDDVEELRTQYMRTFEAYEGAYAPPAESIYEEWWDGTHRELLSGPSARDMRRRYEAIEAGVPDAYPPDHVAMLLEYASLLLESGDEAAYARFHEDHFDWIPAFRERVDRTSESAFYRWAVALLEDVVDRTPRVILDE